MSAEVDRFQQFLRIRSVSSEGPAGAYTEAVQFLLKFGHWVGLEMGLTEHKIVEHVQGKPILILTWRGTDPSLPSILLNSHYDVVPADESMWNTPPFAAHRDESTGNIYARGTQDMKCVCMQYLEAIGRLKASVAKGKVAPPLRTLHLSFLPDEESGGIDGALAFTQSDLWKEMNVGLALDEGLANPEDKYTVFYGERCVWWIKFKATGPTGHGSRFIPRTAVEAFNYRKEQEALLKHECGCKHANAKKLGDVTTLNITGIRAGVPEKHDGFAVNCIPMEAIAAMDIRIPPSIPLADVEAMLSDWTSEEGVSFEFYTKMPEHRVTALDEKWWGTFKASFDRLGKTIEPEIFPAATDSRYFRLKDTPCFGFSPISNTPILLHDHNEFLNEKVHKLSYLLLTLKVFLEGIKVYETVIADLFHLQD